MARLVFLVCALVLVSSKSLRQDVQTDVDDFLQGFFTGVQTSGTITPACSNSITSAISSTDVLTADIASVLSGDYSSLRQLYNDIYQYKSVLQPILTDCDIKDLKEKLEALFSTGGLDILMTNIKSNAFDLISNYNTIKNCNQDFEACGTSVGAVFKDLTGWSLKKSAKRPQKQSSEGDFESFFDGLVDGLKASTDTQCYTDIETLESLASPLVQDLTNVLNGNADYSTLIMDAINFKNGIPQDLYNTCDIDGLYDGITQYFSADGLSLLKSVLLANAGELYEDVQTISSCSTDYEACGTSVGDIVEIFTDWTI
jgi:hypothetical protein